MHRILTCVLLVLGLATGSAAAAVDPLPFVAPARLPDAAEVLSPSLVHLDGWIGPRLAANEAKRLVAVDTEPLLAGFHQKPGTHPWIGEHIGKWLHAATLAWAYTGDQALHTKLDRVVADLVKAQEPDGYLGTYVPEKRFGLYQGADWDVWSHKYNLIGLLTYHQYTGDAASLAAARKIGDLLIATFPAKKSIIAAGTHVGMAATSVLEPVVLLYRSTGDERYLEFARYIVRAWDEPNGPKILASLRQGRGVNQTANGKAYEMLSNLVGVCELARATGDSSLLEPILHAWSDIVANRLYLTGSASAGEHFQPDHVLPNQPGSNICETCVTTTWIQLNLQLLRLTGEAKFGDELERTIYNHLAAAQNPRGDDWCYYTALEGTKPYDKGINCCHSSGPRGMALVPQTAYLKRQAGGFDVLAVSTLESSHVRVLLGGTEVWVEQTSAFPRRGRSVLTLRPDKPVTFGLSIRTPAWAGKVAAHGDGVTSEIVPGWLVVLPREWKDGDKIELSFELSGRLVQGDHTNAGKAALTWGPFVLAYDPMRNPGLPGSPAIGLSDKTLPLKLKETSERLEFEAPVVLRGEPQPKTATFVTFADAGSDGGRYRVWLRAPGYVGTRSDSLLADGVESRSRRGNQAGSINDDDPGSFVVTFDGRPAKDAWFAVTLDTPVEVRRVAFVQGQTFHDGGWFDTPAGKPRVQVQRIPRGAWETIGALASYPDTTATDPGRAKAGVTFTLALDHPEKVVAVRVIGTPASGDNPAQAFASCAELMAFGK
jgi:DUF1680 family protein